MPKICGFVNYDPSARVAEAFNGFAQRMGSIERRGVKFSHFNSHGAFIGLACAENNLSPYTVIYKNIKYTFIFDGWLENSHQLLQSIKDELGYLPSNENDHGALAAWAYILWGGFSPQRLCGRFSYAIYSEAVFQNSVYSPKLFIARDLIGIKPLYFSYVNNTIVFSSSVSSILSLKSTSPRLQKFGLWQILFLNGYSITGRTVFKDIYELQAGCCAYIDCRFDGSFRVMEKRYHTVKHPKFCNYKNDPLIDSLNKMEFIEESAPKDVDPFEDLEKCVSITEAPYLPSNFGKFKEIYSKNPQDVLNSNIGKDTFEFTKKNYLKSFFPWIDDPYENVEYCKRELISADEGFNYLYEIFRRNREIFQFEEDPDITEKRIRMCLNYFYRLPNELKFNEKLADHYNLKIKYPYASREVFEHYCSNPEKISTNNPNYKIEKNKNSEFENTLKQKLKAILSNSEYRINYIIDGNKIINALDKACEFKALRLIYLTHIWLEAYKVDFDF